MEFDLWDELAGLERRMDELVRAMLGSRPRRALLSLPSGLRHGFIPTTDVFVRGGGLVIRAELPGIDPKKDVSVSVEDGELVIRGERRCREEVKEEDYVRVEASYGAFERRVPIPQGVEEAKINATYADGVLEVIVPAGKPAARPKPRAIPIRSTGKARAA